jgi:Tol biopolymer transport system component
MVTAALAVLALGASGAWAKAKTKRITVKSNGDEVNTDNEFGAVSRSGRFVTFESVGKFTSHDDGFDEDVFIHDRKTHKTKRVSLKSNGKEEPAANSAESAITPSARYVAFVSDGNLGGGDGNGMEDVYVRDRKKGKATRVSVSSSGHGVNYDSFNPSISANGRYVAFESRGAFVSSDTNGAIDVYVRDLKQHKTRRASLANDGAEPVNDSRNPSISADGRYVAFQSFDKLTADSDYQNIVDMDVFVRDMKKHKTIRASLKSDDSEASSTQNNANQTPVISGNGRFVAFSTDMYGRFLGSDNNNQPDVYEKDLKTGNVTRVSVKSNGQEVIESSGAGSERPLAISSDGKRVLFEAADAAFVGIDTNMERDVYMHDRTSHKTTLVSVTSNGGLITTGAGGQQLPAISANGHWAVFQTIASLAPNDAGMDFDVFERGPLG